MKRYTLKSLVQNGSHARKKIKSDVIIGDTNNGYGLGDILDANATMDQVNSKMEDVLGVNGENVNSLIEILNDDDATTGILTQLNAKANDADLSVVAKSGSYNDLEDTPANVSAFANDAEYLTEDTLYTQSSANGHDYVEIGGIKWATMNIGASQPSDYGLYFAWGDTQGYTAEQVGSGEGQKYFGWADYKYGNGTSSPGATGMTKYNATDGLTTLEAVDDAAVANWGGSWRMPTTAEFQALGAAVNTAWTQVNNVYGILCTDKTDSSKTLFFPAAGYCLNGSVRDVGGDGDYWSSSLYTDDRQSAYDLSFYSSDASWVRSYNRFFGYAVRCVLDTSPTQLKQDIDSKQDAITSNNKLSADLVADGTTNKVFTATEKTKLSGIATGAEVNVQSDWNEADSSADDYIKNKPTNVSAFTNDAGYLTENSTILIQTTPDANGHTYVDLGLPSGTLWATMNVGASSETDYGNYYKYGLGASQYDNAQAGYTDTESPLSSSADTAVQVWGGSWHMPTKEQMQELTANTTYRRVTNYKGSGINGGTFTATNGAVLFIPFAGYLYGGLQNDAGTDGYCWSSSPDGSSSAYLLHFGYDYKDVNKYGRNGGYSVRPVIESSTITKTVKQILTDAATAAIAAEQ